MTVGPTASESPWSDGRISLPFLLGFASGWAVASTSWIVSLAVVPIRSSASCAWASLVTPGSSTRMRSWPWRTSVDSATPRASTRPRRTCSVLSTFSALAGVWSVPSAWKTNCAPPLRSRPRLGLTLIASARHPTKRPSTRKNRTQTPRDMRDILQQKADFARIRARTRQRASGLRGSAESGRKTQVTVRPSLPWRSAGVGGQLAREVGVGPADDERAVAGVLHRADLGLLVDPVDQVAALVGQQHVELHLRPWQLGLDRPQRLLDAVAGPRADHDAVRLARPQAADHHVVGRVGLVDHDDLGDLGGADLGEHPTDRRDLSLGVGVGAVDDVEQQVAVGDLLKRRAERLDQAVGQVADEAHGVGHRVDAAVSGRRTPRGGVERREERVLDQHARVGEPVEQRGLAGVGVAGDRDAGDVVATPRLALDVAGAAQLLELLAQLGDPGVDAATVGLDLRLTGAAATDAVTAGGATAGLAREVATPAAEALLHVLKLRQLDLRLALLALRVLGEDVEDQRGAVDDLDLDLVLEVAQLAGGELPVADHGVGAGGLDDLADRLDLAAADEGRRVGRLAALEDRLEHLGAGGLGERGELGHRVLGVGHGAAGPHTDQHDPLEAQL